MRGKKGTGKSSYIKPKSIKKEEPKPVEVSEDYVKDIPVSTAVIDKDIFTEKPLVLETKVLDPEYVPKPIVIKPKISLAEEIVIPYNIIEMPKAIFDLSGKGLFKDDVGENDRKKAESLKSLLDEGYKIKNMAVMNTSFLFLLEK